MSARSDAEADGRRYGFTLAGGRVIHLRSLDQWWTYGGLLLGTPHERFNRRIMDMAVQEYTRKDGGAAPALLEPLQTPLEIGADVPPGSASAALPEAVCVARFHSQKLPDDDQGLASWLRVIWFQDDFAFPIDPGIVVELQALDWEARAHSWVP